MIYQDIFKELRNDMAYVEDELKSYTGASETLLGETSSHLLQAGGKRLRPTFIILAGKFFNYSLEKLAPLAAAIELIHMASLVHDDVIDKADTRRGIPTVSSSWGNPVAVFTGDYLFAEALSIVARFENDQISRLLANVSLHMCEGEIEQMEQAGCLEQSLSTYLRRIKRKTAILMSACCVVGALASEAPVWAARHLQRFGYHLGMAFQISDDTLDFVGMKKVIGKPVGSDLRQGIITLPVICALRNPDYQTKIRCILRQEQKTEADWQQAVELIKESGALDDTRHLCNLYLDKARSDLACLPNLPPRRIFAKITDFISTRDF
jgi:heptaprenyl diphosphate synthase